MRNLTRVTSTERTGNKHEHERKSRDVRASQTPDVASTSGCARPGDDEQRRTRSLRLSALNIDRVVLRRAT